MIKQMTFSTFQKLLPILVAVAAAPLGSHASDDGLQGYSMMQNRTFRGNNLRTGVFTSSTAPTLKTVKWKVSTGGKIFSSPIAYEGVVYCGSLDGNFYALDAATGKEKWKFVAGTPIVSTATIAAGLVYFTADNGKLYALETATGKTKWEVQVTKEAHFYASPAVSYGVVFVGGGDKRFILNQPGWGGGPTHGYDALTGKLVWEQIQSSGPQGFSAVTLAEGILIQSIGYSSTGAYNLATGEACYEGTSSDMLFGSVFYQPPTVDVAAGIAYYTGRQAGDHHTNARIGTITAIEYKTGKRVARTAVFKDFHWSVRKATGLDEGRDYSVWTAPTLANDQVLVGCNDSKVYAFAAGTLARLWTCEVGGAVRSSLSVVDKTAYFAADDGHIYALDTTTGKILAKCPIGGTENLSSPSIAEGILYIGNSEGILYAIE